MRKDHKGEKALYLTHVERPNGLSIAYDYHDIPRSVAVKMKEKRLSNGWFLKTDYFHKGVNKVANQEIAIKHSDDPRVYRVKSQSAPVGPDSQPITTHEFLYDIKHGWQTARTLVFDAYKHQTIYFYDYNQRLTQIEKFKGNGPYQLEQKEKFIWLSSGSKSGNLAAKILENSQGQVLFARKFEYDEKGNVTKECCFGNFSGNSLPIVLSQEGIPLENGAETYTKTFTYSQNTFNTIESENDGMTTIRYGYFPNTNLMRAKLVCESGKIRIREFYEYDQYANLIETIRDDGCTADKNNLSGVTERQITTITPRYDIFTFGYPQVVEEKYIDFSTNEEKVLKRQVNSYTKEGWLCRQEIYDCHRNYCYTLFWEHDRFGNVIRENDPLGNIITRNYNEHGALVSEIGPRGNSKNYQFDLAGRLVTEEEVDVDGTRLKTSHRYDYLSNRLSTTDPFGQAVEFTYDDFNRLIKTTLPAVVNSSTNVIRPVTYQEYDTLGHVSSVIDAEGHQTRTTYNVRGDPTRIDYPDGTCEVFTYHPNSTLKSRVAKNGAITLFTYDFLKRPIQEDVYAADGVHLKQIINTYNAFHLTSKIDAEGILTSYRYDGAGRLISETKDDKTIEYAYDHLGRCCKVQESESVTAYLYDDKDQLIEERLEDREGTIFRKMEYNYDADGNRIRVIQNHSVTTTTYNSRKQPIKVTDPLGNSTIIFYDYTFKNELGQYVLRKSETNPLGTTTHTIYDSLGRASIFEIRNPFGKLISKKESVYDGNHRLVKTVEDIISAESNEKQIITLWEYNKGGQLVHLTEAAETPEQKHTHFRYNAYGQKEILIKPDGIELHYAYDAIGRLSLIASSDQTVAYAYTYNRNDQPICVQDLVTQKTTERNYNAQGHLVKENLAHGLSLESIYDQQGRPISLVLPDASIITYRYDAAYMREVSYQNLTHYYLDYDLNGNLLKAKLIGQAGELNQTYDSLNRVNSIFSECFNEENICYNAVGNIEHYEITPNQTSHFTYDHLNQLQSEEGVASHHYLHDSLHNRLNKNGISHIHNSLNQLVFQGETHYQYDPNGNVIRITNDQEEIICTYDALDRLIKVTKGDFCISYTYDAFNRRLTKTVEEAVHDSWGDYFYNIKTKKIQEEKRFIYQGQCEIGCYEKEILCELRILGIGKGAEIGAAVAVFLKGEWYAPLHDHNGNVSTLVDSTTGNVFESYRYTAFGEEFLYDQWERKTLTSENPWRFASKRKDFHTLWIAFGRRDYDPTLGRWITPDPQGFEDGSNLYAYVHNNPLTRIDLWGLEAQKKAEGHWIWKNRAWVHSSRLQRTNKFSRQVIGKIADFHEHYNPVPILRHAIGMVLRGMAGLGWNWKDGNYSHHSGLIRIGDKHVAENERIIYVNGVNVGFYEGLVMAHALSEQHGNTAVYYVYNSTHSLARDLMEFGAERLGLETAVVQVLDETITMAVNEISSYENGKVTFYGHSEAAQIFFNATRDYKQNMRKKISVVTLGGAKMIAKGDFMHADNVISDRDYVSLNADRKGIELGKLENYVRIIPSLESSLVDHSFTGKTYQGVMEEYGTQFKKRNGLWQN